MLKEITENSISFAKSLTKKDQKLIGQYITPDKVAKLIAERILESFTPQSTQVKILDPGAGTGILGVTLVSFLTEKYPQLRIKLVGIENEQTSYNLLRSNYELVKKKHDNVDTLALYQDFVLSSIDENDFDLVISNPPYLKLKKDSPETKVMKHVVHGAPNLYGFFWAQSVSLMKRGAIGAFIIPRSWMAGAYFSKLREYLFTEITIRELHTFEDRSSMFGGTNVLQEVVIVVFEKSGMLRKIRMINYNSVNELNPLSELEVEPQQVILGKEKRMMAVSSMSDLKVLTWANSLPSTVKDAGLALHTGLTVDFKNRELLRDDDDGNVPIFYAENITECHTVELPTKNGQFLSTERAGLLQNNKDYLFIKRFSTKEQPKRINVGYYQAALYPKYQKISTDNKLNFVTHDDPEVLIGAYLLFSTTAFDKYYRLLSGSTQVNATEINTLRFMNEAQLQSLGKNYKDVFLDLTQGQIDNAVEQEMDHKK